MLQRCVVLLMAWAGVAAAQNFEVAEASVADLQKAMTAGRVTSRALVEAYLRRIDAFDAHGPKLNSMIVLNPRAVQEAEALDRERASKKVRGPLHGVPVIVKDNYSTADMQTTAGTIALVGFVPARDAFQVKKLREAGAVILGKSNLHELASGITTISSAGGQTLNPYDPTRNPGGSSGGTGAAIAASFAAVGMGSDTCGSIRIPSSHNNLVGLRPTKGLSSIAGVVPLSVTQDVAGPLARTVDDLAIVLDATIGEDPNDAATVLKGGQARPRFRDSLQTGALKGARIGVLEALFGDRADDQDVIRVVRAAAEEMKAAGAELVPVAMPDLNKDLEGTSVIEFEFQEDLKQYLASHGEAPVHSLREILENGLVHVSLDANLRRRLDSPGRDSDGYRKAMEKRAALAAAILKVMEEQKVDALLYPTMKRRPVRVGDAQPGSNCQLSPSTGFPAIAMQAGFTPEGLPVGVELLGRAFDDAKLVALAYDFETRTHHRRAPAVTPALGSLRAPALLTWQASDGRATASGTYDPATAQLRYQITGKGLLAATLHRTADGKWGPAVAVLATHPFEKLAGVEVIGPGDIDGLMKGTIHLRVLGPGASFRLRVALKR